MSSLNDELSAYLSKNITEKYKRKCELFKKSLDFSEKNISGLDNNSLLETEESAKENLHSIENSSANSNIFWFLVFQSSISEID